MAKILLVADTYYPDSRATIMIAQRIAEELTRRGHSVAALPLHLENKRHIGYPEEHNNVKILKVGNYFAPENKKIAIYKKANAYCFSIALAPKKLLIKEPQGIGVKWNEQILRIVRKNRKLLYENPKKKIALLEFTDSIQCCIEDFKPDVIVSVALPFDIHYCVSKLIQGTEIAWIPTCFDPYAFDEILSKNETRRRSELENRVYSHARAVIMLSQFRNDYSKEKTTPKIRFVELPNIRPIASSRENSAYYFDPNHISCAFIGNLYGSKRNPSFLFDFFARLVNSNIHLYIIGTLIDITNEELLEYSQKLNGRLHYLGRVGQQDAIDAMFEADVLVNVGHTTSNQCPSKVLDYMCTGKPILHISKTEHCSSIPYLKKYDNWFCVEEKSGISREIISECEDFILSSKSRPRVPFSKVLDTFPECTIEKYVDTLESCLLNNVIPG